MRYRKLTLGLSVISAIAMNGCNPPLEEPVNKLYQDKTPKLVFTVPLSIEELETKLPEIPKYILKIPCVLPVIDASGDGRYDIVGCQATYRVLGTSEEEKEFFRTEWEKSQNFEGNDIQRQPLEISLNRPYFQPGKRYEITVSCWDKNRERDSIKAIVNLIE